MFSPKSSLMVYALVSLAFSLTATVFAFPAHQSLAGLSERELADIVPRLADTKPGKPPGPLKHNGTKIVNDQAHPWMPLRPGDIRGPCPGLNTLASHGYLPRDGVATPSQIVAAVQEGFNMENPTALFTTYAAMLVDGNLVTDLLSIGGKTKKTGPDPPAPAIVGGLNTHSVFEGDASLTRGDIFFGDNHSFNKTLFDQFVDYSNRYGGGFYNLTAASELRFQRIKESIATNPQFSFISPRYFTAYAETIFPIVFFVDGRNEEEETRKLDMSSALSFFRDHRFPDDFHRRSNPAGPHGVDFFMEQHPVSPGANQGEINSYVVDPNSADFGDFCKLYTDFVDLVKGLYPNPTGVLRRNLIINLGYFHSGIDEGRCTEVFPYGQM